MKPGWILVSVFLVLLGVQACRDAIESPRSSGPDDSFELGAILYARNCQVCHGDQSGRGARPGVPLHNETGHTWHHPDAQLTEWVLEGRFGGAMPAFASSLSEEEVEAILAFIKTRWTEEQRETQDDLSRRYQEALDKRE